MLNIFVYMAQSTKYKLHIDIDITFIEIKFCIGMKEWFFFQYVYGILWEDIVSKGCVETSVNSFLENMEISILFIVS